MAKKVKKKARSGSGHKEKQVSNASLKAPKTVDLENNPSAEIANGGAPMEKERKVCVHFEKGVDLTKVSSKIESGECTGCEDCREGANERRAGKGKGKHGKRKGASDSKSESKATWVCLHCGHFSCGGVGLPTNPQCHALRHARQNRHPLTIQVENPHLRWCFSCSMLIPVDKVEDTGEQKDILSDIVKLLKKQPSKGSSVDVEEIWFGSGSILAELKTENKEVATNGNDFYSVRGLVNLGNTCFFNSVMQNLLAMDVLREFLLNYDGSMGPLTSSLKKIFVETSLETNHRNVINPRSLFGCLCVKAPQFRGYQQQDSHEMLRCLLDGLSSEELCAKKSVCSSENGGSLPVSPTFVDAIFGGRLSSTVCCVECGHSSVVYEHFLDLSLSVPTKKPPSKKAQPASRSRKTKMPPKRVGRNRPKLNKAGDLPPIPSGCESSSGVQGTSFGSSSAPVRSGCNPSTSNESSSGVKGTSLGCSSSADLGEASNVVDVTEKCSNSTEQEDTSSQAPQSSAVEADGVAWLDYLEPASQSGTQDCDSLPWLDYVETVPLLEDQKLAADSENIPISRDFGSKDDNCHPVPDTAKSSVEAGGSLDDPNLKFESTVYDSVDECPVQVQDNQILLLPYKEDSATAVEGMNMVAEVSSSSVAGGEDALGFEGLGDLFNEPEVDVPAVSVAKNFQANSSGSDPDEVDNTDSPVSIESCLAHFIKPELLSGEHGWHCENCAKLLLEERRRMRKKELKITSKNQTNLSSHECSSSEVLQVGSHPPLDCSTTVLSAQCNGSTDPDESLKKLDSTQINGLCPISTEEKEESSELENTHSHASGTPACLGPSDEASFGSCSIDSHRVLANHDPIKKLSGRDEDLESGEEEEEEEEDVDSSSVKVMRDATKRILINKAPPILTIHLKRFGQDTRGRLSKLSGHVGFKEYINLGSYLDSRSAEREDHIYRLVGVVEHSGSMRGGHYVAYVRGGARQRGRSEDESRHRCNVWYHASDAHVRETTLEEVLGSEAYLLFYENVKP